MCKKLREIEKIEINKIRVDLIKEVLTNMKKKNVPKNSICKTEENKKIIDIVKTVLELNNKIQSGKQLKVLTPSQMLSRLPISLAQLKAGNDSKKLKNEIRQLLYSLRR